MKFLILIGLIAIGMKAVSMLEIWDWDKKEVDWDEQDRINTKQRKKELRHWIFGVEDNPDNPNYHKLEDWRDELRSL